MDEWKNGWVDEQMGYGGMNEWATEGWTNERMRDKRMSGWVDEWMSRMEEIDPGRTPGGHWAATLKTRTNGSRGTDGQHSFHELDRQTRRLAQSFKNENQIRKIEFSFLFVNGERYSISLLFSNELWMLIGEQRISLFNVSNFFLFLSPSFLLSLSFSLSLSVSLSLSHSLSLFFCLSSLSLSFSLWPSLVTRIPKAVQNFRKYFSFLRHKKQKGKHWNGQIQAGSMTVIGA